MRAPRWFRMFRDWRWSPCVALILGALAFVGLALLFIPAQFTGATRVEASVRSLEQPSTPPARAPAPTSWRVSPAPSAPDPAAPDSEGPTLRPRAPAEPPPAEPPTNLAVQDFSANIADRGDRPISSPRH